MRLTMRKAKTNQGPVLVEQKESRSNGHQRSYSSRRLTDLSVLVEFLNQRYDEYGISIWEYDTSLLAILYRPFLDVQGLTKEQLINFYAETKRLQLEIRPSLNILIKGHSHSLVEKFDDFGGSEFRNVFLDFVYNLYCSKHLEKLAVCLKCNDFFVRAHAAKEKHCSDQCRESFDQKCLSGARHLKQRDRMTEWLSSLIAKPTNTSKGHRAIDPINKALFGSWKEFNVWKSELQFSSADEILKSLSAYQKKTVKTLMKASSEIDSPPESSNHG